VSSVARLPASLTVNTVSKTPLCRYNLFDATAAALPAWGYGGDLAIAGAGADPTIDLDSPLLGSIDGGAKFNEAKYYVASENTTGSPGQKDICLEFIAEASSAAAGILLGKRDDTDGFAINGALATFQFIQRSSSSNELTITATLTAGAIYHAMCFLNISETVGTNGSQWYINGEASGTGGNCHDADIDVSEPFGIGARPDTGANPFGSDVFYVALYAHANWFQAGAAGPAEWATVADKRFKQLRGYTPRSYAETSP